ncbi:hypothetical protein B0T11DRAFT_300936 [Plectosphaerella cucumerina]|uniref:Uncharacterized protein n=1 Tax=Plectosphaerella cucumerina TaxID=40658 RepID=A0A8K0TEA6_9PEZI|nr:hypothetical protein B0T11DRAFT_300936 [Plectosphaerella cucumerina]
MKPISTFSRLYVLASLTLGAFAGSRPPRPIIIGNDNQAKADVLLQPGRGASEGMGCERMSTCVPKSDWKSEGGCSPETQHVGVDFSDCQDSMGQGYGKQICCRTSYVERIPKGKQLNPREETRAAPRVIDKSHTDVKDPVAGSEWRADADFFGSCNNNVCRASEVVTSTHWFGLLDKPCIPGRGATLCCQPNLAALSDS